MKLFVAVTGSAIAVITFLAVFYMNNQRMSLLDSEGQICRIEIRDIEVGIERLQRDIDRDRGELARLERELANTVNECPSCTLQAQRKDEGAKPAISDRTHCWHKTPLYLPGFDYPKSGCEEARPENYPWPAADPCNFISLGGGCRYRHLFGVSFERVGQLGWGDLMMLDFAFASHPTLVNAVEFGTFLGTTSLHLAQMANLRGGNYTSYDIGDMRARDVQGAWKGLKNMHAVHGDLLKKPYEPRAKWSVEQPNTFVFFDNGDKTGECNNYMQYLNGDEPAFCTHDWDIEVGLNGIQDKLAEHGFEPFAFDHAEMLGSHTRCFTKKANQKKKTKKRSL